MDPGSPSTCTVINPSDVTLSCAEISLLSRRLSFCPTPHHFNKNQILDDLEGLYRPLCLKEFFIDQTGEDSGTESPFCPPSTWMLPKDRDAAFEADVRRSRWKSTIRSNLVQKRAWDNLLRAEREALRNLWD